MSELLAPVGPVIDRVSRELARTRDDLIRRAFAARLGCRPEDVDERFRALADSARLTRVYDEEFGLETYALDGEKVIEFGQIGVERSDGEDPWIKQPNQRVLFTWNLPYLIYQCPPTHSQPPATDSSH